MPQTQATGSHLQQHVAQRGQSEHRAFKPRPRQMHILMFRHRGGSLLTAAEAERATWRKESDERHPSGLNPRGQP